MIAILKTAKNFRCTVIPEGTKDETGIQLENLLNEITTAVLFRTFRPARLRRLQYSA